MRLASLAITTLAASCIATPASLVGDGGSRSVEQSPECSECRGLDREECSANLGCESIPYWGESLAPCETDERGFQSNCLWVGCRQSGMAETCPSRESLASGCPSPCDGDAYSIDQRGCRQCRCRANGLGDEPVADCAFGR